MAGKKNKPQMRKFGVEVPDEDFERIDKFCDAEALIKWRAMVAGFRLLEWAPAELRRPLMDGDEESVRKWFELARAAMAGNAVLAAIASGSADPFLREVVEHLAEREPQAERPARRPGRRKAAGKVG